jgi:predicted O-methyltransferase YrrM
MNPSNLRLVEAIVLAEYFANTLYLQEEGNTEFARRMSRSGGGRLFPKSYFSGIFSKPYVLYHSWMPGFEQLSAREASAAQALIANRSASTPLQARLAKRLGGKGWLDDTPVDLHLLTRKAIKVFPAVQNPYELGKFLKLVKAKRPRTVLEIGTARGGLFYCLSQLSAEDALLISIDLPGGPNCGGQTEVERKLFATFGGTKQVLRFLPMNSQYATTKEKLRVLLDGRKLDLLFIDGDHSYGGISSDFAMYREFVAHDGLVIFHDILITPEEFGPGNDAAVFWNQFAKGRNTSVIIDPNGQCRTRVPKGIDRAWGFGILHPGAKRGIRSGTTSKRLR